MKLDGFTPLISLNFLLKFEMELNPEEFATSAKERSFWCISNWHACSTLTSIRNLKKVLLVRCLKKRQKALGVICIKSETVFKRYFLIKISHDKIKNGS